jgi:hypothetical protein
MNCHEVDRAFIGSAPLSAEAQEHVMNCPRCQDLIRSLNTSAATVAPSPSLLQRIEKELVADLRPVRPLWAPRYFLAAFVSIVVLIVAVGVYSIGAHAVFVMGPWQFWTVLCALGASTWLLAWSLVHQMAPGSHYRLRPEYIPAGVIVLLLLVMASLFQFKPEADFWRRGSICLAAGTAFALLAAVPFWLLLRPGANLWPRVTGATAGLFAGLVGTAVLEIHCPDLNASHILVWHVGVAVLGAACGLATGLVVEIVTRRA